MAEKPVDSENFREISYDEVQTGKFPLPTRKTRKEITIGALLFNAFIIVQVVFNGSHSNTLHESALSWSYTSSLILIMGYVFGAVMDNFNVIRKFK
jgi:hypothetical protein